ncbi:MAG TPA: hypothetical protein VH600_22965 [Burkholderiales bacterium]
MQARGLEAAALALYVAAVLLCTILVVGYRDVDFLGALVGLTLPWSLITVVFIRSLIRGASLWLFWLVYLGGGAANVFLLHRYLPKLYERLRR